jgi:hypothetical protein
MSGLVMARRNGRGACITTRSSSPNNGVAS